MLLISQKGAFSMKKLFSFSLVFVLSLALLAGCGSNKEGGYEDGTYKAAFSHTDGHGWIPTVEVTVKDGKIDKAMMDYVKNDGSKKSEDENYAQFMKSRSGIAPAEAYAKLNERLVNTQDITKVDAVAGATSSSEWFTKLVPAALENAKKGDQAEAILPMKETYKAAQPEFDDHGWKSEIAVTFEDGKIVKVEYNEVNKDGQNKKDDAGYAKKMKTYSGTTPAEAQPLLEKSLVEKQDPNKVDVVTGATNTSSIFVELAKEAIAKRVEYKK